MSKFCVVLRPWTAMLVFAIAWTNWAEGQQGTDSSSPADLKWRSYVEQRNRSEDTFESHLGLANWCDQQGLTDQRDAHLSRALLFQPENRELRQRLQHVHLNGRWYSPDQVRVIMEQEAAAERRFRDWALPISRIAKLLSAPARSRQDAGWQQLTEVTDPRAVTAIEILLPQLGERISLRVLDVLHGFYQREATEGLLRLAINSPWESVREKSLDLLSRRNRFDYVPGLMGQLVSPIESRFAILPDSRGNVLYQYQLFQQNLDTDALRQFDSFLLQAPDSANGFTQQALLTSATQRAQLAESQLLQWNQQIAARNQQLQYVLARTTGQKDLQTPNDWWTWWYDQNEVYAPARAVTYSRVSDIEIYDIPLREPQDSSRGFQGGRGECLVAGTLIWTDRGALPVESLQVGDRVLTRDLEGQSLEFRSVLQPTRRPKTATFRLRLNDDWIQASGGHLFWVENRGWMMVRELEPEMAIATASGPAVRIQEKIPSSEEPLFNLVVDGNANYFVGRHKILSHDSSIGSLGEESVEQGR